MKRVILIVLALLSFSLLAGTMPNNDYKLGSKTATVAKGFTFDTGDGAGNVSLKTDDLKKLVFTGNDFQIGDGATGNDKELTLDPSSTTSLKWNGTASTVELRTEQFRLGKDADNDIALEFGRGGSNPQLLYNSGTSSLQFSNDGSSFNDIPVADFAKTESCRIKNLGASAEIDTDSGLCESWMDTVTWISTGIVDLGYTGATFSNKPVCSLSVTNNTATEALTCLESPTASVAGNSIRCTGSISGLVNVSFNISCTGER